MNYWIVIFLAFVAGFIVKIIATKHILKLIPETGMNILGSCLLLCYSLLGIMVVDFTIFHNLFPEKTTSQCALMPYLFGWFVGMAFAPSAPADRPLPVLLRAIYFSIGVAGMIYFVFFN